MKTISETNAGVLRDASAVLGAFCRRELEFRALENDPTLDFETNSAIRRNHEAFLSDLQSLHVLMRADGTMCLLGQAGPA